MGQQKIRRHAHGSRVHHRFVEEGAILCLLKAAGLPQPGGATPLARLGRVILLLGKTCQCASEKRIWDPNPKDPKSMDWAGHELELKVD